MKPSIRAFTKEENDIFRNSCQYDCPCGSEKLCRIRDCIMNNYPIIFMEDIL